MTTQKTTSSLARSPRFQQLVRVALLVLVSAVLVPSLLLTGRVEGAEEVADKVAEEAVDPCDALYDVIMTRYGQDGKSYAENENSPSIFYFSRFPFGDKTYKKFTAALDAFAALPQAKIEAYSEVKRALLQRHLWKVFDVTFPPNYQGYSRRHPDIDTWPKYSDRRAAVQPKVASLIKKLALTSEQILALPNTLAATVKSGRVVSRDATTPRTGLSPSCRPTFIQKIARGSV
jgi:hypothetical protein